MQNALTIARLCHNYTVIRKKSGVIKFAIAHFVATNRPWVNFPLLVSPIENK